MCTRFSAWLSALLLAAAVFTGASDASAAFHLMKVVQVFAGTPASPNAQYVELQMYGAGQTFVSGQVVQFYDAAGNQTGVATFSGNVTNGSNQATILIATSEAATFFGLAPDLIMTPLVSPAGGMVCFDTNIDCVAWGNYTGPTVNTGSPFHGPPALPVGIPAGQALLRRLDISGSPSVLDFGDDTNNSNNDFIAGLPSPRNNAGQVGTLPPATCGNSTLQGLEQCDDGNTIGGDGCRSDCAGTEQCGDGLVDAPAGEACEDGNGASGDGCDANCTVTACGNGIVTAGEACDDGNVVGNDGCSSACVVEACGDGTINGVEVCDDGNTVSGDGCRADCLGNEVCGDGLVDVGEACDDDNIVSGDGCRADCLGIEICGDGLVDVGEGCDDDNLIDTDACLSSCVVASCGDGFVQSGVETCEPPSSPGCTAACELGCAGDGDCADTDLCTENEHCNVDVCESDLVATDDLNACTTDACDPALGVLHPAVADGSACDLDANPNTTDICLDGACSASTCGDGYLDGSLGEACDDGNLVDGDGCQASCALPACGDGVLDTGEDCDDANTVDGDGCTSGCVVEDCGDGVLQAGLDEACDDGNLEAQDGCSPDCALEECGDGVLQDQLGEQCDDGNDVDGDGCEANCTTPICGNSIIDSPEQCDDGNELGGDGCNGGCILEDDGTGGQGGGSGGGGGAGGGDGDGGETDDGCACRAVGSGSAEHSSALLILLGLAALGYRRRRPVA